jgi:hypothetical protein
MADAQIKSSTSRARISDSIILVWCAQEYSITHRFHVV